MHVFLSPYSEDTIEVKPYVVRVNKFTKQLKFHNDLTDSDGNLVKAEITFYDSDDKGEPGKAVKFCDEDPFVITADHKYCNVVADPGDYAYSIKAPPYKPFDPVIIWESVNIGGMIMLAIGLLATYVVGHYVGLQFGRKSRG